MKCYDESTGDSDYMNESTGKTRGQVPEGALIVTKDADGRTSFQRQSACKEEMDEEIGSAMTSTSLI